jgi:adenine deaminase
MDQSSLTRLIDCAAGRKPADILFTNCRVVCVFTREIFEQDVAVIDGRIAGIGTYEADKIIDLDGRLLCPGFLDGHIHLESSMLVPEQFAAAVIPHGTSGVICDPHEIANVCGISGIDFMLSRDLPLSIFAMAPSCVPATDMETSGAELSAEDIDALLSRKNILGLAEMMNFPGTSAAALEVLEKIMKARTRNMLIDGHAPGLSGRNLQAYTAAGISSDYECTTLAEAEEKLRAGMSIFIREGSTARNLKALMPLINSPASSRCLLVTDDRHADDLVREGHLDFILRKAVSLGADPVTALQMVTINTARHFGLANMGAIAPGYHADLVVLDNLENFAVKRVFHRGRSVARHGELTVELPVLSRETIDPVIRSSVNIDINNVDLNIPAGKGLVRVITCTDGEIVTGCSLEEPAVKDGLLISDTDRDIIKIAVIERHHGSNGIGLGFVRGLGITDGAMASTVAHDSHNLIVVGSSDAAMMQAAEAVITNRGGLAVAGENKIYASLPLPIAGLMAEESAITVCTHLDVLKKSLERIGTAVENPFMLLSFLALPVIPELKITDKGLVDVTKFQIVPLQTEKN